MTQGETMIVIDDPCRGPCCATCRFGEQSDEKFTFKLLGFSVLTPFVVCTNGLSFWHGLNRKPFEGNMCPDYEQKELSDESD